MQQCPKTTLIFVSAEDQSLLISIFSEGCYLKKRDEITLIMGKGDYPTH